MTEPVTCKRCSYTWIPSPPRGWPLDKPWVPKVCAACKNYRWQTRAWEKRDESRSVTDCSGQLMELGENITPEDLPAGTRRL